MSISLDALGAGELTLEEFKATVGIGEAAKMMIRRYERFMQINLLMDFAAATLQVS